MKSTALFHQIHTYNHNFSSLVLAIAITALGLLPISALGDAMTLEADSFVSRGDGQNAKHGKDPFLNVKRGNTAFLRFGLTSSLPSGVASSDIDKATLKVFVSAIKRAGPVTVSRVTQNWAERTVPAGNISPSLDASSAKSFNLSRGLAGNWIQLDVTDIVKAWLPLPSQTNFGIALSSSTTLDITIDSKENTGTSHPAILDVVLINTASIPPIASSPGINGPEGPMGPSGLTYIGDWSNATNYNATDAISFLGSSYISLQDNNTNQSPDTSPQSWALLAKAGDAGTAGPKGDTGAQGLQGVAGPKGDAGVAGPQGLPGPQGPIGFPGAPGATGAQGPQGATGSQGPAGPRGATGAQGPAGPIGATGPQGPAGTGGGGNIIKDANGNILGIMVGFRGGFDGIVQIYKSGYFINVNIANGRFAAEQTWWINSSTCNSGSAYRNAGGAITNNTPEQYSTRNVFYLAKSNSLYVAAAPPGALVADSVNISPAFIENQGNVTGVSNCTASATNTSGWLLTPFNANSTLGWTVTGNPLAVAAPLVLP